MPASQQPPLPKRRGIISRLRKSYAPNVRARAAPPTPTSDRRMMPRAPRDQYSVWGNYLPLAAGNTNRQNLLNAPKTGYLRIVSLDIWLDTNDLEIVEIYWGAYLTLLASSILDDSLFHIPFTTAYSRFTRTWGVGVGPPGQRKQQLSLRRVNGTAGQTLHAIAWYHIDGA